MAKVIDGTMWAAQPRVKMAVSLVVCFWVALGVSVSTVAEEMAPTPAQDFTLKTNTGQNLRLAEQKGKVILLNFWASWCPPCREELPLLDAMHKKYEKLGFSVWGVNIDEDPAAASKVLEEIPVQFPILMDTENSIAQNYAIEAMPTTYIIDRAGNLRYLHKGFQKGFEVKYEKDVKRLLRE